MELLPHGVCSPPETSGAKPARIGGAVLRGGRRDALLPFDGNLFASANRPPSHGVACQHLIELKKNVVRKRSHSRARQVDVEA